MHSTRWHSLWRSLVYLVLLASLPQSLGVAAADGPILRVHPDTPQPKAGSMEVRTDLDGTFDIDMVGVAVEDALLQLAEALGLNLVLYPGVQGTVTAHLRHVSGFAALDAVLFTQGLMGELSGDVLEVAPIQSWLAAEYETTSASGCEGEQAEESVEETLSSDCASPYPSLRIQDGLDDPHAASFDNAGR